MYVQIVVELQSREKFIYLCGQCGVQEMNLELRIKGKENISQVEGTAGKEKNTNMGPEKFDKLGSIIAH